MKISIPEACAYVCFIEMARPGEAAADKGGVQPELLSVGAARARVPRPEHKIAGAERAVGSLRKILVIMEGDQPSGARHLFARRS